MRQGSILNGNRYAAFFAAVTMAALCFTICLALKYGISNFESATNHSLSLKIHDFLELNAFVFCIGWIFACSTACVPFFVTFALAKMFRIQSGIFFVAGGWLMGSILTLLAASVPNLGINEPGVIDEAFLLHRLLFFFTFCSLSGLIAGLTQFMC